MPVILKNNALSTLATGVTASDTGIVVVDGSQFPAITAGEYFYATLVSQAGTTEIIKVTARVGNSMTVVRAQDGSTAATFQAGTLVEMRVNVASIADLRDEAVEISIADAGGYYTSGTVEGALQETALVTLSRLDVATLLADTALTYSNVSAGVIIRTRAEGFAYVVAISSATNHHVTTAGGVKLYVQAGDSGYNVKAFGAKGDGITDDTTAIRAAISAVPNNSTVVFLSGTYLLGAAGLDIVGKTGVTLLGAGAKIKLTAVSLLVLTAFGAVSIRFSNCIRSGMRNIEIDGNSIATGGVALVTCTECFIDKVTAYSCGINAIILADDGGIRNRFTDNLIHSAINTSRGMWLGNVTASEMETEIYVSGNVVRNNPASGIVISSYGGIIEQNYLYSNAGSGIVIPGYTDVATRDITVANNYCKGNLFFGIQSDVYLPTGDAGLSSNVTVTGNVCINHGSGGIYAVNTRNWTIVGNVCNDNINGGIEASDKSRRTVIQGNTCCDTRSGAGRTQKSGIRVIAGAASNSGAVVTGNLCQNNIEHGIFIATVAPYTLSGVSVVGNVLLDNSTSGIFIAEATVGEMTNFVVSGNVCSNNTTVDLRLSLRDVAMGTNRYTSEQGVSSYNFTNADTTPSVVARRYWVANNTSATAITSFSGGSNGQEITIRSTNGNTTINQGSFIQNKGLVDVTIPTNGMITYVRQNTVWFESSRSF